MIPQIIHYCWFGKNYLPPLIQKCIESWKKYLLDYEIKEWNEDNFDINITPYTRDAYLKKKYAFVSDYVRFYVLYHYGGIYLDTDVEILKTLNPLLHHKMFSGFESKDRINPGLILGAEKKQVFIKDMIDGYNKRCFINSDGSLNNETVVSYTTKSLISKGLILNGKFQVIDGFAIYPMEYFSPKSLETGRVKITINTYSIHYYAASWRGKGYKVKRFIYEKIAANKLLFYLYKKYYQSN
jgi:mannosyltransferase OCH1-like enzyme